VFGTAVTLIWVFPPFAYGEITKCGLIAFPTILETVKLTLFGTEKSFNDLLF